MSDHSSKTLYERMKNGEPVIGCKLTSRSPLIAELIGWCGYDYVFIDGEHSAYNIESLENAIRATQLGGAEAIVRIVDHDPGKILQLLDIGVSGILVPHVENGEQAKAIMDAAKYYPRGHRGFSDVSRAAHFGLIPMSEHRDESNKNTMIIAMIESYEACQRIEEILDAGVDAIAVGRKDLSESMGFGGEINDAVTKTCEKARAAAKRRGIPVSGSGFVADEFEKRMEEGCRFFNVSADLQIVRKALTENLNKFKVTKESYATEHGLNWE